MSYDVLTCPERSTLDQLEAKVEAGLADFDAVSKLLDQLTPKSWENYLTVGASLLQIRDERLYKPESFEAYCLRRWTYTGSLINRRIRHFEVLKNLSRLWCQIGTARTPNEAQSRELYPLPAEQQADVWQKATEESAKPTAARLKELAAKARAAVVEIEDVDLPPTPRQRKQEAKARARRDDRPRLRTCLGRCVVRGEWLAGQMPADERDDLIEAFAAVRAVLSKYGPWEWEHKAPVVTVFPDGRTSEDRKAERERGKANNPNYAQKERDRKKREREAKQAKNKYK